eukprot:gene10733-11921_t
MKPRIVQAAMNDPFLCCIPESVRRRAIELVLLAADPHAQYFIDVDSLLQLLLQFSAIAYSFDDLRRNILNSLLSPDLQLKPQCDFLGTIAPDTPDRVYISCRVLGRLLMSDIFLPRTHPILLTYFRVYTSVIQHYHYLSSLHTV